MLKILITYFSQTGNTESIAEVIYETITGEKTIKPIKNLEENELESNDFIFIGFPVHSHSVPFPVESVLKKIPPNKKIAFFSTHGSLPGSKLSREALEYASVLTSKAKLIGSFTCRGKVSPESLEILEKSPEHKAWAYMAASAESHPDENDFADAASFAKWIMTLSSHD
ncbi:MAG: flavodoxin family protein [Candidatus Aminicenantaceae bacterium]